MFSSQQGKALVFGVCIGLAGLANAGGSAVWHHSSGSVLVAQWSSEGWRGNSHLIDVPDLNWQLVAVDDVNGDGEDDTLWRHKETGLVYSLNLKKGILESEHIVTQVADLNWELAGVGDLDGDKDADLVWRNRQTGLVYFFELQNGVPVNDGYYFRSIPLEWKIVAVADIDNDGQTDLFWRNQKTGENYVFLMDKFQIKAELQPFTVEDPNWQVATLADLNVDGSTDVLWRNKVTDETVVWFMKGGHWQSTSFLPKQSSSIDFLGVADVDDDGEPEILWQNKALAQALVWKLKAGNVVDENLTSLDGAWKYGGWIKEKKAPDVAPFGETALFLRGSLNGWAALEDARFSYTGKNHYQLKRSLPAGAYEFKIADSAWKTPNCGGPVNAPLQVALDKQSSLSCNANSSNLRLNLSAETQVTFDLLAEDLQAPKLTLVSATQDLVKPEAQVSGIEASYTQGNAVAYSLSATDNENLKSLSFEVRNASNSVVHSDSASLTGKTGSKTGSLATTSLAAGVYSYGLTVSDAAGNQTSVTGSFEIKAAADTTKPGAQVSGIAASYTQGNAVAYSLSATDNENLKSLSFEVRNASNSVVHSDSASLTGKTGSKTGSLATTSLAAGVYSYDLTVSDAAGNQTSVTGSFEIKAAADTTKPGAQVSGIAASYTQGNAVAYSLSATDNENLKSLSFEVRNASNSVVHSDSASLTGKTGSKTGSLATTSLAAGVYSYGLTVSDAAGNQTSVTGSFEIKAAADTTKPGAQVSGIAASYTQGNAVAYSLSATDNENLKSLSFEVRNASNSVVHSDSASLTGKTGSKTGSLATTSLAAGVYSYGLTVSDAAGNQTSVTGSFEIKAAADTTKPGAQVSGIAASYTQGNAVAYSLSATDNENLKSLSFEVRNASNSVVHSDSASLTGKTGSKTGSIATTSLAAGLYSYGLTVSDVAGNQTSVTGSFEIKAAADTTKPGAQVSGIAASYTQGNAVAYSLSATDNENLKSLSFEVRNASNSVVHSDSASLTGKTGSKTGSLATTSLAAGLYSYGLTVSDAAGNQTSVTGSFEIKAIPDTTKPGAQVTGINASYAIGTAISYSLSATDNENLKSLSFEVRNASNSVVHSDTANLAGTTGSKTGSIATTGWAAGTYSYGLTVTDVAGNSTTVSGSFALQSAFDSKGFWDGKACAACHASGALGAPILGQATGWHDRATMISALSTNPLMAAAASLPAADKEALVDWIRAQNGQ